VVAIQVDTVGQLLNRFAAQVIAIS
jgi:hypothetical protein